MRDELVRDLKSGQSVGYGIRLIYLCMLQTGMPFVHNRLIALLKELDLVGIAEREFGKQLILRGHFIVEGPNPVWAIDGHHKLRFYGIEIYAAIDAYSRYVNLIPTAVVSDTNVHPASLAVLS